MKKEELLYTYKMFKELSENTDTKDIKKKLRELDGACKNKEQGLSVPSSKDIASYRDGMNLLNAMLSSSLSEKRDVFSGVNVFKKNNIDYLKDIMFDKSNNLNVLDYKLLREIPQQDISQLCVEEGLYGIPTSELVDFILSEIEGDAIEIGSGNGSLARALNIKATDNFMQSDPSIKALYEASRQATVNYGKDVEKIDAVSAIKKHEPDTVIGSWITHKYDINDHEAGGNMFGVDEHFIMDNVKKYIFIGNSKTHQSKRILKTYSPKEFRFEWLVSRSLNKEDNVIWIFKGGKSN